MFHDSSLAPIRIFLPSITPAIIFFMKYFWSVWASALIAYRKHFSAETLSSTRLLVILSQIPIKKAAKFIFVSFSLFFYIPCPCYTSIELLRNIYIYLLQLYENNFSCKSSSCPLIEEIRDNIRPN